MTYPITPPPELVEQWADMLASHSDEAVFSLAAQWGADQELEACCALMDDWGLEESDLRAARRPQPQGPTDEELIKLFNENNWNHVSPETFIDIARSVLELQ
jgi:hypothetical protein